MQVKKRYNPLKADSTAVVDHYIQLQGHGPEEDRARRGAQRNGRRGGSAHGGLQK